MLIIVFLYYKGCSEKVVARYNLDNVSERADFANLIHRIESRGEDIRHYEIVRAESLSLAEAKEALS